MEYYICRAMEAIRLTEDQLAQLQWNESKKCFMPHEIQKIFNLPPLKEAFLIPEIEAAQSAHNQRIRSDFRRLGLSPEHDISPMDIDRVHSFDETIREADRQGKINFTYQGAVRKRRTTDEIGE